MPYKLQRHNDHKLHDLTIKEIKNTINTHVDKNQYCTIVFDYPTRLAPYNKTVGVTLYLTTNCYTEPHKIIRFRLPFLQYITPDEDITTEAERKKRKHVRERNARVIANRKKIIERHMTPRYKQIL